MKAAGSPSGSLRHDLRRVTHEKIVTAALRSFAEIGFRATSVERIVELSGTSAPTFYRHFPGKNDLLIPLRYYLTTEVADAVMKLDGMPMQNRAGVRGWMNEYIAMWRRVHRLCAAYWEATNDTNDLATEAIPATIIIVDRMTGFLAAINPGQRTKMKVRLALLIVVMDRIVALAEAESSPAAADLILDQFAEILWISVFAEQAVK